MTKIIKVKCKNCHKKLFIEIKLNFGARNENNGDLLDCFLNEANFHFNCPFCQEIGVLNTYFFTDKKPKISQITENPSYIG